MALSHVLGRASEPFTVADPCKPELTGAEPNHLAATRKLTIEEWPAEWR
jgi:hypothetical protein